MHFPKSALSFAVFLSVLFGVAAWIGSGPGLAQSGEENSEPPIFQMPNSGPFAPERISIPNSMAIQSWARSGHADAAAEAFRH